MQPQQLEQPLQEVHPVEHVSLQCPMQEFSQLSAQVLMHVPIHVFEHVLVQSLRHSPLQPSQSPSHVPVQASHSVLQSPPHPPHNIKQPEQLLLQLSQMQEAALAISAFSSTVAATASAKHATVQVLTTFFSFSLFLFLLF